MPEVMRCVLLCILEAAEGLHCLLEVLEVPEMMRCVLLRLPDAVLYVLEVSEVLDVIEAQEAMRCVLLCMLGPCGG